MDRTGKVALLLGVVSGTRGLRGELRVRPLSPDALELPLEGRLLHLRGPAPAGGAAAWRVAEAQELRGQLLLRLEGVDSIGAAEALAGRELELPAEEIPPSPPERPWWFELEGMEVRDRRRGTIGRLEGRFVTAAHPVYVVDGPLGEILIPAVPRFVVEVDRGQRLLLVDLPEGLIPETDDV